MSQRELVGGFVMHGEEALSSLHGRRDKRFGDKAPTLRLDNDSLIRPDAQATGVGGIEFDVDFGGIELAKDG